MIARKLNLAACAATLALAALPAVAGADTDTDTTVCNEAEYSPRGGYVVTDGPVDPNPPAVLRGSQMRVGDGEGLVGAAEQSPALRLCGPEGEEPTDPTDPTDPGEGGGDV